MTFAKDLFVLHTYCRVLKFMAYHDETRRNQPQIQEPCCISDEALCNFLPLPIVAKSSILNVAEFLDPPMKTSPCKKTSPVSCKNQSFFLLFQNVATFIESHCFLFYFLQYDELILSSLLDGCYHYIVFMDPVNGYSKSKSPV